MRGQRGPSWLLATALLPGCSSAGESGNGTQAPARRGEPADAPGRSETVKPMRVGNQVRGIDAQPDYDGEAAQLRKAVEPRLPAALPTVAVACRQMLDAVLDRYTQTQGAGSEAVTAIKGAQAADVEACTEQTSAAAAVCVAYLIADGEGEYPWLLDQCSRAFPRQG